MPLVQETFYISPSIAEGLATGHLVRTRPGVVRIAKGQPGAGQIVKELEWIQNTNHNAEKSVLQAEKGALGDAVSSVGQFVSNNKYALIIAGVVVLAVTVAGAVYVYEKKKEPQELKIVRKRFDEYMTAIKTGKLDYRIVDQLSEAIDDLRALKNYKKIKFQLTAEEFCSIVSTILEYTKELVNKNNYQCSPEEKEDLRMSDDHIFDLKRYLELQKKVIVEAS